MSREDSRTDKAIKNSMFALFTQIIYILVAFITRTIFIKFLGIEFLGINGLFTNILSLISFAELGFGTAITYAMYRPLAMNDIDKISALMNFYKKVYNIIAFFVAIVGLLFIPFLDYIVSEKPRGISVEIIFCLFLMNTIITYLFSYKRSILFVSQNSFIDSMNRIKFGIVQNIFQIIVLVMTKNFYLYLIIQIICTFASNIEISIKVNKLFPNIIETNKSKLSISEKSSIYKNVVAMVAHKFGSVIVSSTDNILIAKFIGIGEVGIYSNYVLIIGIIRTLSVQIQSAITASVGNLIATESNLKSFEIFKKIFYANYILTLYCSTCLFFLFNDFISIWLDKIYCFPNITVALIIINFYIIQLRQPSIIYIDAYGLFWQVKLKSIIEGIANFVASVFFISFLDFGVNGVLIGTILSNLLTNFWWEPYAVYKYGFKIKLNHYFTMYFKFSLLSLANIITVFFVLQYFNYGGWGGIILKFLISIIITTLFVFFYSRKLDEFVFIKNIAQKIINMNK